MKKSNFVAIGVLALIVILVGTGYRMVRNTASAGGSNDDTAAVDDVNVGAAPGTDVTINQLEYGSDLSARLNFVRGATTTAGGFFRILNTGSPKICDYVEVDRSDATGTGGATGVGNSLAFSVSTSTSATKFSTVSGGIIASTTMATSTAATFTNVRNPGTYVGADQDVGGESWLWDKGVWLLGAFDDQVLSSGNTRVATDSAAYTGMDGNVYVRCHVRK